jgi:hypothetical protein
MPNNKYNSYGNLKNAWGLCGSDDTKENFGGVFSIQGALKTPNYGNYNISQKFDSPGVELQNQLDLNCANDGSNCSTCPKKNMNKFRPLYTGVL